MTTKVPDSLLVGGGGGGGTGDMLAANNLSEVNPATARTNLGLGTLATQNGTFSGSSSGTNTGDQNLSTLMVKANSLSDVGSVTTARTNLGLGTLATQNGTFSGTHSGTSSGTNTGDQVISDATITTTDVTTNNASTTKHGFLPKLSGSSSQYLDGSGAWSVPGGGGAGSGDVVGPGSAVDNAVVRMDSTTGKLIQSSTVIIGDTGNVTGLGTINTHTIPGGTGTLALTSQITGTNSGTNTGDQDLSTLVVKSNNLSDLPNASTARTNLGLGTMAVKNVTVSSSAPSGGSDGDLWFQYTP